MQQIHSGKAAFVHHSDPDLKIAIERDGYWESWKKAEKEGETDTFCWSSDHQEDTAEQQWSFVKAKRNWMPHTVALLVISPGGDQIATALPGTARRNDADYIQTPPQMRMSTGAIKKVFRFGESGIEKHVQKAALVAAREFLNMTAIREYNNQHFFSLRGREATKRNRLWYVGTTRGNDNRDGRVVKHGKFFHWVAIQLDRYKDVFRNDSKVFQNPQWVNVGRLAAMPQSMIMSQRKFEMIDQALLEYGRITGNYSKLVEAANQRQLEVAA